MYIQFPVTKIEQLGDDRRINRDQPGCMSFYFQQRPLQAYTQVSLTLAWEVYRDAGWWRCNLAAFTEVNSLCYDIP